MTLKPRPKSEPCSRGAGLFLANFYNRGLDHVLELLLGLVPNNEPFTVRIGGYVRFSELDGFNFAGLPVLEGHIFLAHAIHTLKLRAQINAV